MIPARRYYLTAALLIVALAITLPSEAELAAATTENFFRLFSKVKRPA